MEIIIDAAAGTASIAGVSRSVVYPIGYAALPKIVYSTKTGVGLTDTIGNYTMSSIISTALLLWRKEAPTAADIWELIKAKRTAANEGGINVGGNWYHTDPETLAQYAIMYAGIAVYALPGSYVFVPYWKTMAGNFHPMTVNLLKIIIGRGTQNASENFTNSERHRIAMVASREPYLYDYSAGWVKVYK